MPSPIYPGHPVFDTADRLERMSDLEFYPSLSGFFERQCPPGAVEDFQIAVQFLSDYQDVSGTFTRFRGELQRFLLYLWVVSRRNLAQTNSEVMERYFQFLKTPPSPWVAIGIHKAFEDHLGRRVANDKWRPFVNRSGGEYHVKQTSLDASSSTLRTFFRFAQMRGYIQSDPLLQVRKRSRKAILQTGNPVQRSVRRLTDWQWAFLLEHITRLADDDEQYERHLFAVVSCKSLYLRIGELAPRPDGSGRIRPPTFGDFGKRLIDGETVRNFHVFGKGDKMRCITVSDHYLPYLKRYRNWRGLTSFPAPGESSPLFINQAGLPLGKRQVTRLVEETFARTVEAMRTEGFTGEADDMATVAKSTHYLRHTGASQDIEAGRDIRHVSEELGHASAAFTEAFYVNADEDQKYRSGRARRV